MLVLLLLSQVSGIPLGIWSSKGKGMKSWRLCLNSLWSPDKLKPRKNKYGVCNSFSKPWLEQFRRYSKCKTLDEFLHLSPDKRKEIVEEWLRLVARSNSELMRLQKTVMIFTFLYKKRKLTKSMSDLVGKPVKRNVSNTPI